MGRTACKDPFYQFYAETKIETTLLIKTLSHKISFNELNSNEPGQVDDIDGARYAETNICIKQ